MNLILSVGSEILRRFTHQDDTLDGFFNSLVGPSPHQNGAVNLSACTTSQERANMSRLLSNRVDIVLKMQLAFVCEAVVGVIADDDMIQHMHIDGLAG